MYSIPTPPGTTTEQDEHVRGSTKSAHIKTPQKKGPYKVMSKTMNEINDPLTDTDHTYKIMEVMRMEILEQMNYIKDRTQDFQFERLVHESHTTTPNLIRPSRLLSALRQCIPHSKKATYIQLFHYF